MQIYCYSKHQWNASGPRRWHGFENLQDLMLERLVMIRGISPGEVLEFGPRREDQSYVPVFKVTPRVGFNHFACHWAAVSPFSNLTSTFQSLMRWVRKHTASVVANFLPKQTLGPTEKPKKLSIAAVVASEDDSQRVGTNDDELG